MCRFACYRSSCVVIWGKNINEIHNRLSDAPVTREDEGGRLGTFFPSPFVLLGPMNGPRRTKGEGEKGQVEFARTKLLLTGTRSRQWVH